jgi:hypothetical protein
MFLVLPNKDTDDSIVKKMKIKKDGGKAMVGIIVLFFGLALLWNQLFPYTIRLDLFWPIAVIGLGVWMISKNK